METVEVSALQKLGLDDLLELILLVSDLEEPKANPNRPAAGTVIEAKLDRSRGPVATVLVQNGTLPPGRLRGGGQDRGPGAGDDRLPRRAHLRGRPVDPGGDHRPARPSPPPATA